MGEKGKRKGKEGREGREEKERGRGEEKGWNRRRTGPRIQQPPYRPRKT